MATGRSPRAARGWSDCTTSVALAEPGLRVAAGRLRVDTPSEAAEVAAILKTFGLDEHTAASVTKAIRANRGRWVVFMTRFELGLEEPELCRAKRNALTIGLSYVAGGLIPLAPYFFAPTVAAGLAWSVALTLSALAAFGYVKGRFTPPRPLRSAWQTVLVGGLAAGAAFGIASLIG